MSNKEVYRTLFTHDGQGAPMPVFESDKNDLHEAAGNMYISLDRILAQKEAELREVDACIIEEEMELSR